MNEGGILILCQLKFLKKFYQDGRIIEVYIVEKIQDELLKEFGIMRQVFSNYFKVFKEFGYIRMGRGFIDLIDKVFEFFGEKKGDVFVFVKIELIKRKQVYEVIRKLNLKKIYCVIGDIDLIIEVDKGRLDEILEEIVLLDGVKEMNMYFVFEML